MDGQETWKKADKSKLKLTAPSRLSPLPAKWTSPSDTWNTWRRSTWRRTDFEITSEYLQTRRTVTNFGIIPFKTMATIKPHFSLSFTLPIISTPRKLKTLFFGKTSSSPSPKYWTSSFKRDFPLIAIRGLLWKRESATSMCVSSHLPSFGGSHV